MEAIPMDSQPQFPSITIRLFPNKKTTPKSNHFQERIRVHFCFYLISLLQGSHSLHLLLVNHILDDFGAVEEDLDLLLAYLAARLSMKEVGARR